MDAFVSRLDELRATLFVGRQGELQTLGALLDDAPPFRLAYVHGIGGMGKTELLRAFTRDAVAKEWNVRYLDARDLPPSPDALTVACAPHGDQDERRVIVLDTFESLSAIERLFRERVVPQLQDTSRLVFAGRAELSPAWNSDPRWRGHLRVLELDELPAADAHEYLRRRGVAERLADSIVDLTGGFPLGLALAADAVLGDVRGEPAGLYDEPSLIDAMLREILDHTPSQDHYRTLMLSALALRTSEAMVAHVVDRGRANELYRWLIARSYVRRSGQFVAPHDVVRHALLANLRWRDPRLAHELLVDVARYYQDELYPRSAASKDALRDAVFLFAQGGDCPFVAEGFYRARASELRANEWAFVEQLVATQIGPQAVEHLNRWRDHPAFEFFAARRGEEPVAGFFSVIRVDALTPEEITRIPGLAEFHEHVGPQPGSFRYSWLWGDERAGQDVSETQTCQQAWLFEMLMTTPDVAATGSLVRADLRWPHQGTQQTKPRVMPETSFVLDGTRFVSFGKLHTEAVGEWHWSMFREWLAMMTASEPSSTDGPPHPSAGEVLAWLKQALKNADRPDCLCDSPLLDFTLVTSRAGAASGKLERARLLVEMLRELSEMFLQSPRDRIYFEVLRRTYFEPSAKQRVVAETLNLSFGSYRRYLATAIQRIADALQRHELAAVQGAGA